MTSSILKSTALTITSSGHANSADFTQYINPPIRLLGNATIGLKNATIPHSVLNFSVKLGNNIFEYSHDGGTNWNTVIIPDGNHNIEDINLNYFRNIMRSNGHYNAGSSEAKTDDVFYIQLTGGSTGKVEITLANSYQIRFLTSSSTLYSNFGFVADTILSSDGLHIAPNNPDFNAVDRYVIHCSAVNGSYLNGMLSDTLYSFAMEARAFSFQPIKESQALMLPIGSNNISKINMRITDEDGKNVNLNGENVSYFLQVDGIE